MAPVHLADGEALTRALAQPSLLLFKHSLRCPTSAWAFREYEAFVEARPEVPTGWLDVVAQRTLARGITSAHGIGHASPQALWFRDGRVIWHAAHGAITTAALDEATRPAESPAAGAAPAAEASATA